MIHKLIADRRSTVLFSEDSIDQNSLTSLFEAARWAPSSLNQQPWRFIYAQKRDAFYLDLLSSLLPKNQEWAKNAPLLMVTVAQTTSDYKNRKNDYAWHDTALAFSNLMFQANHIGLSVHPMGGFNREKTIQNLEIPERYEPVIFAAIGYKSHGNNFSEDLLNRENKPRIRKELPEIAFQGRFPKKTL